MVYLPLRATTQDEIIDELHRGVVHLDVERLDFIGEIVVRPHRGDGDEKTQRGGYQRFRDTAGDGRQTGSLALLDALEGVQNADHGTEHADERRGGADSRQSGEAALHFGVDNGNRAFETALGCFYDISFGNLLRSGLELRKARGH